jgi:hypothetical protein
MATMIGDGWVHQIKSGGGVWQDMLRDAAQRLRAIPAVTKARVEARVDKRPVKCWNCGRDRTPFKGVKCWWCHEWPKAEPYDGQWGDNEKPEPGL